MEYKINEIFYSIQGEGHNTGMPAIFVRFAGCNLNCWFCDTDYSLNYKMDINQLIEQIEQYECKNIVFTGGEPSLQIDSELLTKLHIKDYYICIETNGTRKLISGYDYVTVSPKENTILLCDIGDELKVIYTGSDITDDSLNWFIANTNFDYYYLQPCDDAKNYMNIDETVEMVKKHPKWRLSIQAQKLIDIK